VNGKNAVIAGLFIDTLIYMSKSLDNDIYGYYTQGREHDRLTRDENRLEHYRTQELLSRYLPKAPATIYDVGGGAGVYALWLAGQGYEVHLLDAMPLHIEQAKEASKELGITLNETIVGDAKHLPYPDSSTDAVLLLGPLYHLTECEDRLQALREAYRVLKPNGLVFAVSINRFASTFDGLFDELFADPSFLGVTERALQDGQHRNPNGKSFFTTAFFHHPFELHDEVKKTGFEVAALVGIEGVGRLVGNFDAMWDDPVKRDWILHVARRLESEETLLGISAHLLAIGQKITR
jgi:ubiquinone/menaquinone biosynthesis C-methylase UbiE